MTMTEEEKQKLINNHWGYIEQLLTYHGIDQRLRQYYKTQYSDGFYDGLSNKRKRWPKSFSFHYATAYDHGIKHLINEKKNV